MGDAADRVQRVDERLAGRLLVEREHPAAVGARRPGQRIAGHRLLVPVLVPSGDLPGQQPVRAQVVLAHGVVGQVVRRRVLDQVHPRRVRRERVEGERARQRDPLQDLPACRVEDEELARRAERPGRGFEHERATVAGEPLPGFASVPDQRGSPRAGKRHRSVHLGARGVDLHEQRRARPVREGDVVERAVLARHAGASLGDVDRPVRERRRSDRECSDGNGEAEHERAHDFLLETTPLIRGGACRRSRDSDFDQERVALAAAGADRRKTEPAARAP